MVDRSLKSYLLLDTTKRIGCGKSMSSAQVAKLVDARDLKSLVLTDVPVRFRPWAPFDHFRTSNNVQIHERNH